MQNVKMKFGQMAKPGPMQNLKVGMLPSAAPRATVKLNNSDTDPRNGAAKRLANPAIAGARIASDMDQGGGARHVEASGHPLAFVGGKRPLDSEAPMKACRYETPPVHSGMGSKTPEHRGKPAQGSAMFALTKHADIDKAARLPSSIVPKRG